MSTSTSTTGPLAELLSLADTFNERARTAEIAESDARSEAAANYYAGQRNAYRQAAEQLRASTSAARQLVEAMLDELTSSVTA